MHLSRKRRLAPPAEVRGTPVPSRNPEGDFGLESLGVGDNPPEATVHAAELSEAEAADERRKPTQILAPELPTMLIEPVSMAEAAAPAAAGTSWGIEAVGATQSPFTGSGITVAVLDTGVDSSHEAFQSVNVTREDFTGEGDEDEHGHGTHCAGTIAGRDIGGFRFGVAPGVTELLAGKVLGNEGGSTDALVNGIHWAVGNGANVISMSLGVDFPGAVDRMVQRGLPVQPATSKVLEAYRDNLRLFGAIRRRVRRRSPLSLGCVGLLCPWDDVGRSWVDRHFHPSVGAAGNVLSALAPLTLIVGTVVAVLLAHRSAAWRLVAGGLLVGLGVAGAAKYGGLLANQLDKPNTRTDSLVVLALVAVCSGALAVLGTKLAAGGRDRYASGSARLVAGGLALLGAALIVVGCAVEYNGVTSNSILADDGWFAADPLVGALVALGAIFVGRGTGQAGAGALIAVGAVGLALWPRFIGVPILIVDTEGSAGPGGFSGLLGSSCLLAAGLILAWPRQAKSEGVVGPDETSAIAACAELLDRAALLSEPTRFQRYGIGSPMLNDCCRATRPPAAPEFANVARAGRHGPRACCY